MIGWIAPVPPDTTVFPGHRVVTAAEMRAAGLVRLGDLWSLLDGWRFSTTDGFTYRAAADLPPALSRPRWLLLVDGQRVEPGTDGHDLNALPVALSEIDSVEVVSGPLTGGANWAPDGMVRVFTRRSRPGWSATGWYHHGNETGDPGPYRYTPLATPNVDKIGPDIGFGIGYGGRRWSARLGGLSEWQYVTDTRMYNRTTRVSDGGNPHVWRIGPMLTAEAHALGGVHRLLVSGRDDRDEYRFVPQTGTEARLRRRWRHVGLNGGWTGPGRWARYEASGEAVNVAPLAGRLPSGEDGSRRGGRLRLELGRGATSLGLVARQSTLVGGPRSMIGLARHRYGRRQVALDLTGGAQLDRDGLHPVGLAVGSWTPGPGAVWSLGTVVSGASPGRQVAGFVSGTVSGDARWRLELDARLRRMVGDPLLELDPIAPPPQPASDHPSASWRWAAADGTVGTGSLGVRLWPGAARSARIGYGYTAALGNGRFADAFESVPTHRGSAEVTIRPASSFSAQTRLTYLSATRWLDYPDEAGAPTTLGAVTRLDLTLVKGFFGERVHAGALLANLLNRPHRSHPLGAALDLRLQIRLEATL